MKEIKVHRKYNLNVPSWEELLNNFNKSASNNKFIKHKCPGFFVSHEAYELTEVKKILKKLKLKAAHLYFNVTKVGGTFGKHNDIVDVYYWQVQGTSKWIFEDRKIILKQGDLLFVPRLIYHDVVAEGPRAGISMAHM
jgi:mannose-6-phosphate isomerase-like protein (cupin superfamily)